MTKALSTARVPTAGELQDIEKWAVQPWRGERAPANAHMRQLVGKLLVGYAGLIEMVSSPPYKRLTGHCAGCTCDIQAPDSGAGVSQSQDQCICDQTLGHCPLHGEAALSPLAQSIPKPEQIAQSRSDPSQIDKEPLNKEPRTGDTWEEAYHRLLADYAVLQQGCQAQGKRLSTMYALQLAQHLEHHEIDSWHSDSMHKHPEAES